MKLDGLIFLHLRIGVICICVWPGSGTHLVVGVILNTNFLDRFIRGMFPAERNVVPWHSLPVAKVMRNQQKEKNRHTQEVNYANLNGKDISDIEQTSSIQMACQVF